MRDQGEQVPETAAASRARPLRLALLGLAGAGALTLFGFLVQSSPASAEQAPPPSGSLLGSVLQAAQGAVGSLTSTPSGIGSATGSGSATGTGLLGSIVTPVTSAVDSVVSSVPVVGTTVDGILGSTPTSSITAPVVGTVDGVVGGVLGGVTGGSGGTGDAGGSGGVATPPSQPTPPSTSPGGASGSTSSSGSVTAGAPGAVVAGMAAVPAASASTAASAEGRAGDPAATPLPVLTVPPGTATARPGDLPAQPHYFDGTATAGGTLLRSAGQAGGAVGEVGAGWLPPLALSIVTGTPASSPPPTGPPGEHDVSPG